MIFAMLVCYVAAQDATTKAAAAEVTEAAADEATTASGYTASAVPSLIISAVASALFLWNVVNDGSAILNNFYFVFFSCKKNNKLTDLPIVITNFL